MKLDYDPHSLLLLIAVLISAFVIYRLRHFHRRPIVRTLMLSMAGTAWWAFCVGFEHANILLPDKMFWVNMSYFGIVIIPMTWLAFALLYTDNQKWLTRTNLLILGIIPVISLVVVWTNDLHHLEWLKVWLDNSRFPADDVVTHGVWWWILTAYCYLLLLLSMFCFVAYYIRAKGILRNQIMVLLIAMLAPWIGNVLYAAGVGVFQAVDPTPIAFGITGIAFYWGISRLQLLDIIPLAYKEIFRNMTEGVLVTDVQNRVVDINPSAQKILQVNRRDIIRQEFSSLRSGDIGLIELSPDVQTSRSGIFIGEGQKQLHYGVQVSTITTKQRYSGHVLILHDDTQAMLLANTDGLTGLYNNRYFQQLIEQEAARSSRLDSHFSLLMLDLDFFKAFNDNYGHLAGDTLLQKVGQCMLSSIRTMDSACRYGGEEFTVILPGTDAEAARIVAERIRREVQQIVIPQTAPITVSIGIAGYPADGTKEQVIARSDAAMYLAKKEGRNRVCLSSELDSPKNRDQSIKQSS